MKKYNTGIYQIINIVNNKRYIGSAVDLNKRMIRHFCDLKSKNHNNKYLQRSYNKYGKDNFKFEILLYCDKKDLLFFEQRAIDYYNKKGLYNISLTAGSTLGVKSSKETILKLRKNASENPNFGMRNKCHSEKTKKKISLSKIGKKSWNKGKHHSDETRKKISEKAKGRIISIETRLKISAKRKLMKPPNLGNHHSEESKLKMSISHRGRSTWNKGIKHTTETIKKMSESHKGKKPMLGKKHSEKSKLRMSKSQKIRWKIKSEKIEVK